MEPQTSSVEEVKGGKKLYSPGQIIVASFFGSSFAGVYLLSKNLEILKNKEYAKNFLYVGIALSVLFVVVVMTIPNIPSSIGLAVFGVMAAIASQYTKETKHLLKTGFSKHSGGKVFGIIVLSIIAFFVCALILSVVVS